jgi:hypothetical protein
VADSEATTFHMQERVGFDTPVAESMKAYRRARMALKVGKAGEEDRKVIQEAEKQIQEGENPIPDLPLAARATCLFYSENTSFRWSFVSPSSSYRPGPRTGKYEVVRDRVPLAPESANSSLDGNQYEGRLLGISAADLAVAFADEVEKSEKVGWHWTAVAELPSDDAVSSFARLG